MEWPPVPRLIWRDCPPRWYRQKGSCIFPPFVSEDAEAALLAELERLPFRQVVMHGTPAKRTTAHFGYDYAYDNARILATDPIPAFLVPMQDLAARLADVPAQEFVEALVSRYPAGAGIGWHRDAPVFGEPVVGISLLSACDIRFRREIDGRHEVFTQTLAPRSLYILRGPARRQWRHGITATPALRYSITFRTLRRKPAW